MTISRRWRSTQGKTRAASHVRIRLSHTSCYVLGLRSPSIENVFRWTDKGLEDTLRRGQGPADALPSRMNVAKRRVASPSLLAI